MRRMTARLFGALTLVAFLLTVATADAKETHKKSDFYQVTVRASGDQATITVIGKGGFHINLEYPWKLTVESDGKTAVYKRPETKAFQADKVVFVAPYKASAAAQLKMSLCNDTQCKMEKISLSW